MKSLKYLILFVITVLLVSCKDSPVGLNKITTPAENYTVAGSVTTGRYKATVLFKDSDSLTTGYNVVYFKIQKDSVEQKNGYVKIFPKMWMSPTYTHSTPVSPTFEYDNSTGYYKGYIIFNMPTDTTHEWKVIWWGFITYYEQNNLAATFDSLDLYTAYRREREWIDIYDTTDQTSYYLTLIKPFSVVRGLNDFSVMLHKTDSRLNYFTQIFDAEMFIKTYLIDSNISSTGNISPVPDANGVYNGKINFPYAGRWNVVDSIKYQNRYITTYPSPPEFYFSAP